MTIEVSAGMVVEYIGWEVSEKNHIVAQIIERYYWIQTDFLVTMDN